MIPIVFAVVSDPVDSWLGCEPRATRWEYHWPVAAIDRSCRQATRAFPRDFAQPAPACDHGGAGPVLLEMAGAEAAARASASRS